jgi:hypothetical protein
MDNKFKYDIIINESDYIDTRREIRKSIGIDVMCFKRRKTKDNSMRIYTVPLEESVAIVLCLKVGKIKVKRSVKK